MKTTTFVGLGLMALASVACDGGGDKAPVVIGLSASLSGFDEEFGATARTVTEGAVAEINDAGGINGHPIELIVEDDGSDLVADGGHAEEAIDALIDGGAVAIIGPFLSGLTGSAVPTIRDAEVVLISPSATAPALAGDGANDAGYMFRTAPNDNFQVLAMAHYFADLLDPAVGSFAIVHEEGDYGEGLSDALTEQWVTVRGLTVSGAPIQYPTGLGETGGQTNADAAWDAIVARNPTTIVVIGQGSDTNVLVRTWKASLELPTLQWFFADGSKISSFFGDAATELPLTAEGLRGTAPTSPKTSIAFQTYLEAFTIDLADAAYFPNTWDAVYLIAAALTQQSADGEEFGGADLRDALTAVSKEGQIFHAGQWRDLVSAIRSGGDVDYDGASGPVDFLEDADNGGETISPYEVWEIQNDAAAWSFVQVEYMETADLVGE